MHNKLSKFGVVTVMVFALLQDAAWAVCPPPATPQNCSSISQCSTPNADNSAFDDVDDKVIDKLNDIAEDIMTSIDEMDARVSRAIGSHSSVKAFLSQDFVDNMKKAMEIVEKKRQTFQQDQNTLEATQLAEPSAGFVQAAVLKSHWPATEIMTRAIRQKLFEDHTRRTELENEEYYSDQGNVRNRSYDAGTIAGIAKLYETHKDFFCNAAGANKPVGCGEKAANGVSMGDQMFEMYLGDRTWPKEQVQQSIELMQFYLGITPPELKNVSSLEGSDGQREFIAYQGKLAKNNFLTYILSYLAAKRAPTNEGQAGIIKIRKEAAGCEQVTDGNKNICTYLTRVLAENQHASRAELSRALEFDRFMTPGYITKSISGTLGIEKDLTLMMVDRLQQDYEEYQMDKMITASMAGYYASLVGGR